ncbi:DUF305 domain-containing protein [Rhizobium sp. RCC_161_2]|uniref:DUF305 domain-containing protein n=1 Tax=Rhizobium sp. RCC_161_2 TaxID=3239219 RepID=UPI003523965A
MRQVLGADFRWNWRAAALLGLMSSTFSTLVSQFTAARIGRDAAVDWMVVATIPLRDSALHIDPGWVAIIGGILFHQWADFSWVMVFFVVGRRWTAELPPLTILLLALPWAVFTSSMEWLFLVPLFPFWQPIFPLQQIYWIGLGVHLASASLYPIFPALRDWFAGRRPSPYRRFALTWSGLAAAGVLALGLLAFLGSQDRELRWMGNDPAHDQAFLRRMANHHAQGLTIAEVATKRATDPHLRALAALMGASQKGDIAIFTQWWRSWFHSELPEPGPEEHAEMPGMLTQNEINMLTSVPSPEFDALFVRLMTRHHRGAMVMANQATENAEDPRVLVMARAILHSQSGEIDLMNGSYGWQAVRNAVLSLFRLKPHEGFDAVSAHHAGASH